MILQVDLNLKEILTEFRSHSIFYFIDDQFFTFDDLPNIFYLPNYFNLINFRLFCFSNLNINSNTNPN